MYACTAGDTAACFVGTIKMSADAAKHGEQENNSMEVDDEEKKKNSTLPPRDSVTGRFLKPDTEAAPPAAAPAVTTEQQPSVPATVATLPPADVPAANDAAPAEADAGAMQVDADNGNTAAADVDNNATALQEVRVVLQAAQHKMEEKNEQYKKLEAQTQELLAFKNAEMARAKQEMDNRLQGAQKELRDQIREFRMAVLGEQPGNPDEIPAMQSGIMTASALTAGAQNASSPAAVAAKTNEIIDDISKQKQEWSQAVEHITSKDNTIKQQQDEIDRLTTLVKGNAIAQHTVSNMETKKRALLEEEEQVPAQRVRTAATGKIGHVSQNEGLYLDETGKVCASAGLCPIAAKAASGGLTFREWSNQATGLWKTRMRQQYEQLRRQNIPEDVLEASGTVKASVGSLAGVSGLGFDKHSMANYIHASNATKNSNVTVNSASTGAGLGPSLADFNPQLYNELLEFSADMKSMDKNSPVTAMLYNQYYDIVKQHRAAH